MFWKPTAIILAGAIAIIGAVWLIPTSQAGTPVSAYKILDPIHRGNLTIFPVVAAATHNTSDFLTLDEGLRSGDVVVTEAGRIPPPLMRRRSVPLPRRGETAEVNRLVLINNSAHPLLLLAGEIVTGGKQDRVVGRDRIVPPKSDPVDLTVFCVEPGRWVARSDRFDSLAAQMAQPSVRREAMASNDQQRVWANVQSSNAGLAAAAPEAAISVNGGRGIGSGTSYAELAKAKEVQQQVDKLAEPITRSYEAVLRQLKDQNAVGVVVAVNGELEWADLFASNQLLQKYWPKLVRSYAAESLTARHGEYKPPTVAHAQRFLDALSGQREISETEPEVFRITEVQGQGYKVFRLTSLLPRTGFDLHLAKMTTDEPVRAIQPHPMDMMRR